MKLVERQAGKRDNEKINALMRLFESDRVEEVDFESQSFKKLFEIE